jgi:hypothetical protein
MNIYIYPMDYENHENLLNLFFIYFNTHNMIKGIFKYIYISYKYHGIMIMGLLYIYTHS